MSSQRGNTSRTRAQKHKNQKGFKNNLHDTSNRTKLINSIQVSDVCAKCKEVIEWKIKYKKYKRLTQPKTCVKCSQKTVKQAYHVMCKECGVKLGLCTKCCQNQEIVATAPDENERLQLDKELEVLLKSLPERKRRTFIRYMNKKEKSAEDAKENEKEDLMKKLEELKVKDQDDDLDLDDFDSNFSDEEDPDSDVS